MITVREQNFIRDLFLERLGRKKLKRCNLFYQNIGKLRNKGLITISKKHTSDYELTDLGLAIAIVNCEVEKIENKKYGFVVVYI